MGLHRRARADPRDGGQRPPSGSGGELRCRGFDPESRGVRRAPSALKHPRRERVRPWQGCESWAPRRRTVPCENQVDTVHEAGPPRRRAEAGRVLLAGLGPSGEWGGIRGGRGGIGPPGAMSTRARRHGHPRGCAVVPPRSPRQLPPRSSPTQKGTRSAPRPGRHHPESHSVRLAPLRRRTPRHERVRSWRGAGPWAPRRPAAPLRKSGSFRQGARALRRDAGRRHPSRRAPQELQVFPRRRARAHSPRSDLCPPCLVEDGGPWPPGAWRCSPLP